MKKIIIGMLAVFLFQSFAFSLYKWTFAVYLDADNNLEDAGVADFIEMSNAGSDSNIAIVCQFDRASGYDTSYNDWKSTYRFFIEPGMKPYTSNGSYVYEKNMGSPTTLTNFINWVKTNYPAEKYALIFWNHGGGWRDRAIAKTPMERAVCWDDGSSDDCLYMKEVSGAIQNSNIKNWDLIGFDACLMGHFEVAYQLKDCLKTDAVVVASEETEPGDGWNYTPILNWLKTNYTASAVSLGNKIVSEYSSFYGASSDSTLSCIKNSNVLDVASKLNSFADSINDNSQLSKIQSARTACKAYSEADGYYGVDIYRFAEQVRSKVTNSSIQTAATNLKSSVSSCVASNYRGSYRNNTSGYGSYGLCVYFPKTKSNYDSAYATEILYGSGSGNKWDDFLTRYYAGNLSSGGGSTSGPEGSGKVSLSKAGVAPSTYYTSITYTLTPTANLGGGKVEVTIPSNWTAPQNTGSRGTGYVKAWIYHYGLSSYKLQTSVSGQKLTITGIPSSRMGYKSGDKLKFSYKKFTTQSATGKAYFGTKTAGPGGTLQDISIQKYVTVDSLYKSKLFEEDAEEEEEIEEEEEEEVPATLGQNYPNPFNPQTKIPYRINEPGRVVIKLYNVTGQEIVTILDEDKLSGEHTAIFESGDKLSRGVYYYQLTLNGKIAGTKRAIVLK